MIKIKAEIEDFAQLLMDSNPQYIFWKDIAGVYLGCNKLYAHFCNLKKTSEIIGTSDYDYMSKEEADICIAADNQVINSGKSILNFEEYVTDAHGDSRWYNINKVALKNSEGNVVGVLGTMTDVTEIKEKNQIIKDQAAELQDKVKNLQTLNTKLESINIDLEQFAYSTSHDLKEPLRVIGSFAGLLQRRFKDQLKKEGIDYIQHINSEAKRMSTLVSQILIFSKLDKVEESFVDANLTACMDDVLTEINKIIDTKVNFEINLPEQVVTCQVERIKILFTNLILNGIKFNESEVPTIKIDHHSTDSAWHFSVSDNGIGIDEAYADVIFQPFKRLNATDKFEGNGVGLSICKRIITLHGGELYFSQNKDQGVTFHFSIKKNTPHNEE